VTAERAPGRREESAADVTVLERDRLQELPAENLAEALDSVLGVRVSPAAGFGSAPVVGSRGFFGGGEAEYVLLVVDGIPVGDVESGLADWRRLRTQQLERVEILHGPASSVYGDAALGGVVQAFTRAKADPQGVAELSVGSFETGALDVDWGRPLDRGRVGLAATLSHTGGEREHSGGDEGGADAFFATPMGGGQLRLSLAASRRTRDDPGALDAEQAARDSDASDPLFRFDREETGRARAAVSFVREGRSEVRATLSFALRDAQLTRTLPLLPHVGDRALRDLDTHALAFSMEAGRDLGLGGRESRLRAGFDVGLDGLDTAYYPVGPDGASGPQSAAATGARRRLAGYVTQDVRPLDRLRISGGLRWDGIRDELGGVPSTSTQPGRRGSARTFAWGPPEARRSCSISRPHEPSSRPPSTRSSTRVRFQTVRAVPSRSRTPISRPSARGASRPGCGATAQRCAAASSRIGSTWTTRSTSTSRPSAIATSAAAGTPGSRRASKPATGTR
jgi:vitamin B12 transporter